MRVDQSEDATNRHCQDCRRMAQREYVRKTMEQQAGNGYVRGIEAMRRLLVREFTQMGQSEFSGKEVAQLIANAPGPLLETGGLVPPEDEDPARLASSAAS